MKEVICKLFMKERNERQQDGGEAAGANWFFFQQRLFDDAGAVQHDRETLWYDKILRWSSSLLIYVCGLKWICTRLSLLINLIVFDIFKFYNGLFFDAMYICEYMLIHEYCTQYTSRLTCYVRLFCTDRPVSIMTSAQPICTQLAPGNIVYPAKTTAIGCEAHSKRI